MQDNFEKHIKDAMDNPPEFPFEGQLWKDMESRLDNDGKKKPFMGFIGRLPLLLLALLTTSIAGYFYFKQYKAMEKLDAMEQQFQRQQIINDEEVIEKRITVIYDTIYNKVVIDQVESSYNNQKVINQKRGAAYVDPNRFALNIDFEALKESLKIPILGGTSGSVKKNALAWRYAESRPEGVSDLAPNADQREKAALSLFDWKEPSATIPSLLPSPLEINWLVNLSMVEVKQKKRRKRVVFYLHKLKPTRFSLAGTTGSFTSLNLGGSGFNLRGSAIGEVGMGKRFSVIFGAEYFSNDFNRKIAINEETPVEGFPDLPPINAEDQLTEIQGDFNYLQIPFGVKYIIFPRRYFYPYVGAGLIAGKTTRSRLEYEYFNNTTLSEYRTSQGNLLAKQFELSAFYSTLGIEIQMNRNWSLLLEGGFQFDLEKGNYKYENLQLLKLSTGVQYEF